MEGFSSAAVLFGKYLHRTAHRQAISIVLLAFGLVAGATMFLMLITDLGLDRS